MEPVSKVLAVQHWLIVTLAEQQWDAFNAQLAMKSATIALMALVSACDLLEIYFIFSHKLINRIHIKKVKNIKNKEFAIVFVLILEIIL